MAFCNDCDKGIAFEREEAWIDAPDGIGTIYHYDCHNNECENDGGRVYALADGGGYREEGVW